MVRDRSLADAPGGEVEPLSLEDVDEVEAILAELRLSQNKGNLILCTVSSPAYREIVIQLLCSRFAIKVFQIDKGDQLVAALKDKSIKETDAFVWVLPESLVGDLLEALNNFRELFYQKKVPSVVFLTPAALSDVIHLAPDFWRYRGGFHELKGMEKGPAFQALEALTTPFSLSYQNREDLLRRKRINEYLLEKICDKKERAGILEELGIIHFLLGEYRKSTAFLERALVISREIEDRRAEGTALGNLGNAYSALGETRKAIDYYEQALAMSREIGDRRAEGNHLGNLGLAYSDLGETRKAIDYYEQALAMSREIGDRRGEGSDLGNLGNAYYSLGETPKAIEYYEQVLVMSREIGDRRGEGTALGNLGNAYSRMGETRKAIDYYEQALAISREIGDRRGEGNRLGNLGLALDKLGNREEAIRCTKEALKIFEQIESPSVENARRRLAELQTETSK
jgi:tetratricopeptide (TPR) repeat protein